MGIPQMALSLDADEAAIAGNPAYSSIKMTDTYVSELCLIAGLSNSYESLRTAVSMKSLPEKHLVRR